MAEDDSGQDKTEEPSDKKIQDALKKGNVPKSMELASFMLLSGALLVLGFSSGSMGRKVAGVGTFYFENLHLIEISSFNMTGIALTAMSGFAHVVAFPMFALLIFGFLGHVVQHKPVWSAESLKPKLSKISPLAGAKRIFGKDAFMNLLKGIIKICVVGGVVAVILWNHRADLTGLQRVDVVLILPVVLKILLQAVGAAVGVLAFLAIIDYMYMRHKWYSKLRMTREEVKEEYKQQEGSPEIKAKVRQIQRQRAQSRMMTQVPGATVVLANPTHYSVALKYEKGMEAPVCVAKGLDQVALKIREVAKANNVPIVTNPPLTRALYGTVDIDEQIPEDHYRAVAKIIGYVFSLRDKRKWSARG